MTKHLDEPAVTTQADDAARKTWDTPVLTIVSVDEAESGAVANPDGADNS